MQTMVGITLELVMFTFLVLFIYFFADKFKVLINSPRSSLFGFPLEANGTALLRTVF